MWILTDPTVFIENSSFSLLFCSDCDCLVTQSCPTLLQPMDCRAPLSGVHGISQAYLSGFPFPSLGELLDPGIKSASPALQADSLLLSHQGNLFCCDTIVINPVHMYGSVSGFSILFYLFFRLCLL